MSRVSLATGELSGRQAHSVAFSNVLDAVRRVFMVGVVAFFHKNKLKKSIKKNLLPEANAAVDFMMFFSPEEDGWISVLVEVDREVALGLANLEKRLGSRFRTQANVRRSNASNRLCAGLELGMRLDVLKLT